MSTLADFLTAAVQAEKPLDNPEANFEMVRDGLARIREARREFVRSNAIAFVSLLQGKEREPDFATLVDKLINRAQTVLAAWSTAAEAPNGKRHKLISEFSATIAALGQTYNEVINAEALIEAAVATEAGGMPAALRA